MRKNTFPQLTSPWFVVQSSSILFCYRPIKIYIVSSIAREKNRILKIFFIIPVGQSPCKIEKRRSRPPPCDVSKTKTGVNQLINWSISRIIMILSHIRQYIKDSETNCDSILQWCGSGFFVSGSESGSTKFDQSGSRTIKSPNFQNIF